MIITIWEAKLFVSFVFRFIHSFEEKLNSNLKLIVKVLSKSLSFEEREIANQSRCWSDVLNFRPAMRHHDHDVVFSFSS